MTHENLATPPASLFRRLAAILYDSLLLFGLMALASALMLLVTGGRLADPDRPMVLVWMLRGLFVLIPIGFFSWFWTHGGQTLGMRAWRLKLVSRSGQTVTLRQALIRLAAAVLSFLPAGLGLLWVLVDRQHRAWHDRLSGTALVVLVKKR